MKLTREQIEALPAGTVFLATRDKYPKDEWWTVNGGNYWSASYGYDGSEDAYAFEDADIEIVAVSVKALSAAFERNGSHDSFDFEVAVLHELGIKEDWYLKEQERQS